MGLHEYSTNHFFVVDGPSGRFVVHDGIVKTINDEGVSLPDKTSVNAFDSLLQCA
jgi:hypothetical protein